MQIFNIIAITFAAMATASPVNTGTADPPYLMPSSLTPPYPMHPSLIPPFHFEAACRISELALCASELIGSTAKCNAEIMQNGLNFAADLACLISAVASGVASSIDMCKHCIPKAMVVED
ncbi:hypothetical protein E4U17_006183 [Claviceps sp. LM77 group G4]|nr:hypothetical protein E4U17_006183 [Claviceps sp. LM77 group G4]KAG6063544.1 hypothetical protein E4U33_006332 [Claviceps sp. LM78 group G4]KAG6071886.1 hypothetical protein E4U16_005808 [Claviceps sp. LM84 group G4]